MQNQHVFRAQSLVQLKCFLYKLRRLELVGLDLRTSIQDQVRDEQLFRASLSCELLQASPILVGERVPGGI